MECYTWSTTCKRVCEPFINQFAICKKAPARRRLDLQTPYLQLDRKCETLTVGRETKVLIDNDGEKTAAKRRNNAAHSASGGSGRKNTKLRRSERTATAQTPMGTTRIHRASKLHQPERCCVIAANVHSLAQLKHLAPACRPTHPRSPV